MRLSYATSIACSHSKLVLITMCSNSKVCTSCHDCMINLSPVHNMCLYRHYHKSHLLVLKLLLAPYNSQNYDVSNKFNYFVRKVADFDLAVAMADCQTYSVI